MSFTWYDENNPFSPGRLDYIVYSGSVMELVNSYSLFTLGLSQNELGEHALESRDAVNASDHLPLVADFKFRDITGIDDIIERARLINPVPM